jgi:tight adherence protein C
MSISVLSVLVAVLVILISIFFYSLFESKKVDLLGRVDDVTLNSILNRNKGYEPSCSSFGRFYKKHLEIHFIGRLERLSSILGVNMDYLQGRIELAGMKEKISAVEIMALKIIGLMVIPVVGIPAIISKQFMFSLLAFVFFVAVYFLPNEKINDAIKEREKKIIHELPLLIEQLYMCMESGANLKPALEIVSKKLGGVMGQELQTALTKSLYSGSWEKELTEMAEKINVEPLQDFINDIIIAFDKGISIVDMLQEEVKHINSIRRSTLREERQAIQSKLIIPIMIFFVLPTMAMIMLPIVLDSLIVLS